MKEGSGPFIVTLIALVRIFPALKDGFLAKKFYEKLVIFASRYVEFTINVNAGALPVTKNDVAQYSTENLLEAANSILDFTDHLEHYKSVNDYPLSLARKNILALKLEILKLKKQAYSKAEAEKPLLQDTSAAPKPQPKPIVLNNFKKTNRPLSDNKKKILNFIKKFPQARAKTITEEFGVLSVRTVKRNLKELVDDGFLTKKLGIGRAVYYSASAS